MEYIVRLKRGGIGKGRLGVQSFNEAEIL